MKKFFALAAVVALALTSCVTTTEIPDPAGEISFEAYNFKPQSRAEVYGPIEGSAYPEDEHFGAYAFFTNDPYSAYMSNVDISKVGNVWKNATQKYYWPKGGTLKFWCYSPFGTTHTVTHDNGFAFPNYTTTANLAQQVDLMATNVIAEARPAAVAAVFHHLLSQVGFTAQYDTETTPDGAIIKLDKVELSNVLPIGDYAEGAWSHQRIPSEGTPLTYEFVGDPQVLTNAAQPILPSNVDNATNALVIPQDGRDGKGNIVVTIDYTITYEDTDAVDKVTGVEYKIPAAWEAGKKYIYAITIGVGGEITFDPKVTDWTPTEGGSITIG